MRRAAAFLWMTPLVAALSMRFTAERVSSSALSAPLGGAVDGVLGAGLQLAAHRLVALGAPSFWRLRLIWLLMFATDVLLLLGIEPGERTGRGRFASHPPSVGSVRGPPMDLDRIRNLSIIAHIDHGKTTLADRLLELCGAVDPRDMRAQYLDSMDLERERGITIKLQSVRLDCARPRHQPDRHAGPRRLRLRGLPVAGRLRGRDPARRRRPGHRGPDPRQLLPGLENDLEIVACLNKIDLPAADPDRYAGGDRAGARHPGRRDPAHQRQDRRGRARAARRRHRADPGARRRRRRPAAGPHLRLALRQLPRRRLVGAGDERRAEDRQPAPLHAGRRRPRRRRDRRAPPRPHAGGRRSARARPATSSPASRTSREARSGETVTDAARPAPTALEGYRDPKPMVFCGLYPIDGDEFSDLREALEKLRLNDAQLHLRARDLRRPRLRVPVRVPRACSTWRSSGSASSASSTSTSSPPRRRWRTSCTRPTARSSRSHNPSDMPPPTEIDRIEEPMLTCTILTPKDYTGTIMDLCQTRRGEMREARVPVAGADRAHLPDPARRGRARLLRPAEEPHPGLRQPRLRAGRLRAGRPREGRRAAERRRRPTRSPRSCTRTRPTSTAGGWPRSCGS